MGSTVPVTLHMDVPLILYKYIMNSFEGYVQSFNQSFY
jgi:hypothetical protein